MSSNKCGSFDITGWTGHMHCLPMNLTEASQHSWMWGPVTLQRCQASRHCYLVCVGHARGSRGFHLKPTISHISEKRLITWWRDFLLTPVAHTLEQLEESRINRSEPGEEVNYFRGMQVVRHKRSTIFQRVDLRCALIRNRDKPLYTREAKRQMSVAISDLQGLHLSFGLGYTRGTTAIYGGTKCAR